MGTSGRGGSKYWIRSGSEPKQIRGPLSSEQIRAEARAGTLRPTDGIAKSPAGPWTRAEKVNGLDFADATKSNDSSPASANPGMKAASSIESASARGPSTVVPSQRAEGPAQAQLGTSAARSEPSNQTRAPVIELERQACVIERKVARRLHALRSRSGRALVQSLELLAKAGSGHAAFLRGALVDGGFIDPEVDARLEALDWFDRAGRLGSIPGDMVIIRSAAEGAHPRSNHTGSLGLVGLAPEDLDEVVALQFPIRLARELEGDAAEQVLPMAGAISIAIAPAGSDDVSLLDADDPESSTKRLIARCIRAVFDGERVMHRASDSSTPQERESAFFEFVGEMTAEQLRRALSVVAAALEQPPDSGDDQGDIHGQGRSPDFRAILDTVVASAIDSARCSIGVPESSLVRMLDRGQISSEFFEEPNLIHAVVFGGRVSDDVVSSLASLGILPLMVPAELHRAIHADARSHRRKGTWQAIRIQALGGLADVQLAFVDCSGKERKFVATGWLFTASGATSHVDAYRDGLRTRLEFLAHKVATTANPSSAGHWPIPAFLTPGGDVHQSARACGQPYAGAFLSIVPSLWREMDAHRSDAPVRRAFWAAVASNFEVHPSVLSDGVGELRFDVLDEPDIGLRKRMQALRRADLDERFKLTETDNGRLQARIGSSYFTRNSSPPPGDAWMATGSRFAVEIAGAPVASVHPDQLDDVLDCARTWLAVNWPSIPWRRPSRNLVRRLTDGCAQPTLSDAQALAVLRTFAATAPKGPEPQGAWRLRSARRALEAGRGGWRGVLARADLGAFLGSVAGAGNPLAALGMMKASVATLPRPDRALHRLPQVVGRFRDQIDRIRSQRSK